MIISSICRVPSPSIVSSSSAAGALALEEFDRLAGRLRTTTSTSQLFAPIAPGVSLDSRFLEGYEVVLTSASDPLGSTRYGTHAKRIEPERALEKLLATGDAHRTVVPDVRHRVTGAYRDAIHGGISAAVVPPSATVGTSSRIAGSRPSRARGGTIDDQGDGDAAAGARTDRRRRHPRRRSANEGAHAAAVVAVCADDAIRTRRRRVTCCARVGERATRGDLGVPGTRLSMES